MGMDKTYALVTEHLEYLILISEDKITVWLPKNIYISKFNQARPCSFQLSL